MAGTITAPAPVKHRSRGIVRLAATLLTDASGDATAAVIGAAYGALVGVLYDGGLDASAVITLSDGSTGAAIIAYTTGTEGTPVFFRPTDVITDVAGADVSAAAEAPNVNRDIYVGGKLKVTVASGGNVETGKVAFIVDESRLGPQAFK